MERSGSTLDEMVRLRRTKFTPALPAQRRYWGLALSGGGIRSATFCLGIIKSLAHQGQLRQFDLISTVSGGGYAGSSLGKLMHEASSAQALEAELAGMEASWWLNWLRANGRYLTPSGAKDTLFAFANFGRNLLGVHLELGLMGLLIGCALAAIDLLMWSLASDQAGVAPIVGGASVWWSVLPTAATLPTLFLLLPPLALIAAMLSCAYWLLPARFSDPSNQRLGITGFLALLGLGAVGYATWQRFSAMGDITAPWMPLSTGWLILGVLFLGGWFGGACMAASLRKRAAYHADMARNQLTRALGLVLLIAVGTVLLGWADQLAWHLARNRNTDDLGPALVIIGVGLRAALPMIANTPKNLAPISATALLTLFSMVGMLLLAALLVFWISVVHGLVTNGLFRDGGQDVFYLRGWLALLSLALPALLLVLTSRRNLDFLNRSSLQPFYRARLIRAYLGASTRQRMGAKGAKGSNTMAPRPPRPEDLAVAVPSDQDDITLSAYAPHHSGGPVQLLNVCINQTQDPRGGIFNSDRKGESMTVGPGGLMRVGLDGWQTMSAQQAMGLGDWMAISGAAFAPGLGASTRSGLAALLTLAGIRLGYWWDSAQRTANHSMGKYSLLLAELTGRFAGRARRHWFLSDGGHFDNTAAYALLREECELIVLADCGADPAYRFEDLENLVRKARIDLDTDIVFQRPDTLESAGAYGALADLAANDSDACLALARVYYRATDRQGYLVLVKPNLCNGVAVDLQNFKASNPLFPQEPTTDQFFSEAQWESYFQLGCRLGKGIVIPDSALGEHFSNFIDDDGAVMVTAADGQKQLKFNGGRRASRMVSAGAMSATLSFGAVVSAGLAAWQVFDTQVQRSSLDSEISRDDYRDINARYLDALREPKGSSAAWNALAMELLRVAEQRCKTEGFDDFRQRPLLRTVVQATQNECKSSTAAACAMLSSKEAPSCLTPAIRQDCAPRYWVRQYPTDADVPDNCVARARDDTPETGEVPTPVVKNSDVCDGYTVYIQIYGPTLRTAARLYRPAWRALGANVPPIEDVLDTARRQGRKVPGGYAQPTMIQYTEKGADCASQLIRLAAANRDASLPSSWQTLSNWQQRTLAGAPDKPVIEVWLPAPPLPVQEAPAAH